MMLKFSSKVFTLIEQLPRFGDLSIINKQKHKKDMKIWKYFMKIFFINRLLCSKHIALGQVSDMQPH